MSVNNPAPSIPAGPTAISIGPASSYAVNSVTVTPTTNTTKKAVPSVVYPGTLPVVGQGNLLQAKDSAIKKPLNSVNCGAAVTNVVTSNKVIAGNAPRQYGKHLLPFVPSFSSVKSSRMNPSGNSILAGSSADSSAGGTSISKTKASYLAPPAKAPRMQSLNSHVSSSLSSNIQGNTMMNKPIISLARTAQTPLIVRSIGLQNQISSVSSVNHQDTNKRFSNVTHQPTTTISITVPARSGLNQSDSNSHYRSSTLPLANNIKHTVQQQPLMMNPSTVLVTTPSSNKIQKVKIPAQAVTPSAVRMSTLSSTTVAATGLTPFNFSSSVTGPRRFQVSPITTTAIPVAKVYSQPHSVRIHGVGTTPVSTISVHSRNSNDLLHSLALRPSPMITITSTFSTATATSSSISSTAFSKIATHSNSSFPGQIIHTGSVTSSGGSNSELRIIQQQHLPPVMVASHSSSLNMSPKPNVPNILRRPNRHNTVNEGSSAIQTQKGRYVPQTAHDITSTGIKAVLPASGNVVGKPVVSSNGVATVASKKNNAAKDFAIARNEKEICVARLPQQTIGEIKIKTDQQHVASMRLNTSAHKAESASAHLAQQQLQQLSYQQHSNKTTGDSASSSSSTTSSVGARPAAVPLSHHHQILQQPSQNKARPVQVQRNLVTVSSIVHRPTTERINVYHGATAATSLTYTPKPLVQSCSTLSTSTITMPSTLSSIGSQQQQQQRVLPSRPAGMKRDYDTMMSSGGGGTSTVDSNQHPHHHDKTVLVASSVVAHNSTTSSSYHSPSSSHHRSSMGLSPRKKPRKQTHVVAEELPDDELTDDADECGDSNERNQQHAVTPTVSSSSSAPSTSMATAAAVVGNHNNINNNNEKTTTTTTPVPSSTSAASHHSASSSSSSNNPKVGHSKTNNTGKSNSTAAAAPTEAEEDSSKSAGNSRGAGDELQSSAAARSTSPASEYIDDEGVRYVQVRERPPFSIMNGIRTKSLNNHFTRYSDIKVKPEKRPTFSDSSYDEKRFDLYDMGMFALQLSSLIVNESQTNEKLRKIHTGLLQYCDEVTNSGCDLDPWEVAVGEGCLAANGMSSKYDQQSTLAVSTAVPTNSITHKFGFIKKPYVVRGAVSTDIHTVPSVRLANLNGAQPCHENSLTPKERERLRFRDALLRVDEKLQANMQRCKVAQDVLEDSKKTMIRTLQARELAFKVVEGGRIKQKMPNKSNGTSSSSRTKKKKGL